jgi:hypothetical protein
LGVEPETLDDLTDAELSRLVVNLYIGLGTDLDSLSVTVDGTPLQQLSGYRAESPTFVLSDLDLFGIADDDCPDTAADGYWILLNALPPGMHAVRWTGIVVDPYTDVLGFPLFGGTDLDITYAIRAEP